MPWQTSNNTKPKKHYLSLAVIIVCLAAIAFALLNRQALTDWWQLKGYHAKAAIAQLASDDTMTAEAKKIFYVNHPAFDDRSTFDHSCPNGGGEQTIVLGCYHSNQAGIYLLSINDNRLQGVEQVTAAHEMLHAAYDRLSSRDKDQLNTWLLNFYDHDLHDSRLIATIKAYQKTEPHDVVNEMHSVFGTEVVHLPSALENYYKRYFTNRAQIANYASTYQSEFTSRQAQVKADDGQLSALLTQINTLEADLNLKLSGINTLQAQLNDLKQANNITAYNAEVISFNAIIKLYNAEVDNVKSLIASYNALLSTRNDIALHEGQLYQALSGKTPGIKH